MKTVDTADDINRTHHQVNVKAFLADARNVPIVAAFSDADFDEDITDTEIIEIVMSEVGMTRADVIDRLAKIDFKAARAALAADA